MTALVWGVKASLLEYLAGLDDATTTCADGAERMPDGRFRWPAEITDEGFRCRGLVHLVAHGGLLDIRLESPVLVVADGRAGLSVAGAAGAVEIGVGTAEEAPGAHLVELAITAAGSRLLGDVYAAGTRLDDLAVER